VKKSKTDLKKIQQLLRERKTKKISDISSSPSSEKVDSGFSDNVIVKSEIKEEVQEDYMDILEEIKLRNPTLYESISKLNQYQQKAIFTDTKKALVSAMVGSGKTTVLIHKVLYLHFIKNIPLDKMAVLTFTNKAANEIKERIMTFYMQRNDSFKPDLSFFGTFHSVARGILVNSPRLADLGYTSNFTIMVENEKKEFYLRIADEFYLNIKYRNKIDRRIERYFDNLLDSEHGGILYGNMKNEDELES
jgi:DNA helicase II / ATP-dependent DNA helicase PcrA